MSLWGRSAYVLFESKTRDGPSDGDSVDGDVQEHPRVDHRWEEEEERDERDAEVRDATWDESAQ